ncbi:hypothetical protein HYQ44_009524 [Verticillium longisporum]|nr:hypothetical protein HYQ44_009524 [Verticillium longisporum]
MAARRVPVCDAAAAGARGDAIPRRRRDVAADAEAGAWGGAHAADGDGKGAQEAYGGVVEAELAAAVGRVEGTPGHKSRQPKASQSVATQKHDTWRL